MQNKTASPLSKSLSDILYSLTSGDEAREHHNRVRMIHSSQKRLTDAARELERHGIVVIRERDGMEGILEIRLRWGNTTA